MRVIVLLLSCVPVLAVADVWRFESGAETRVPGAFVYDPLTQSSQANGHSQALPTAEQACKLESGSFTMECFFYPEAAWQGPIMTKTRRADAAAELGLATVRIPNADQFWCGASVTEAGSNQALRWAAGHYSSSTRIVEDRPAWRHLALVYDSRSKRLTCWVDYHLSSAQSLTLPLVLDDGPITFGDASSKGLIDSARITPQALGPEDFLRARADSISGVSFASKLSILPEDSGALNVKTHFGAAGDGKTDDTAALNQAFAHTASKVPLAYHTVVIPAGTYLVSDTVSCSRFIDIKGEGAGQTTIKLKDQTFVDSEHPKPVLRLSSTKGPPGSNPAVNGSSISIYLDGLTIDTGLGNVGAKGLEYHSNNLGRLENVVIRSGDGSGVVGLDLTHKTNGPALIKHLTVDGFDRGIASLYQEYSLTLEHINLSGQREAGIHNQGNILALRQIHSVNAVPAIVSLGENSMITLLDSDLGGGSDSQPAIRAEGGLYARHVSTEGYQAAVEKTVVINAEAKESEQRLVPGPNLDEYIGDRIVRGHGDAKGSLGLPIEETPEPPNVPLSEWTNVAKFELLKEGDDWSPAIQAAIDTGPEVLYFPRGQYRCKTALHLRGVTRIVGMRNTLSWHPDVHQELPKRDQTDPATALPPVLIVDDADAMKTLWIDRLDVQSLRHASPATLVLRSSTADHFSNAAGCGRLFLEDVGGADWRFEHPQRVWARQWNPESHASGPCILSQGATLWCLGFKTEYESLKLAASNMAQTEILGAFIYPLGKVPEDRPIFSNQDSRMAVIYGTSVYQSNHKIHIRDQKGDKILNIGNDSLLWIGSRARMDLFVSE
jgi:Pectate lyase superfamily protein/Concanavalin A-like lectin/glucanases superfamily